MSKKLLRGYAVHICIYGFCNKNAVETSSSSILIHISTLQRECSQLLLTAAVYKSVSGFVLAYRTDHLFVVVHIQDTALVLLLVQTRSCSDFTVAPWRTTKSCPKLSALLAYSRKCILNPGNCRFEESNAAAKRQRLARAIAHN